MSAAFSKARLKDAYQAFNERTPLPLKILAALLVLGGLSQVPDVVRAVIEAIAAFQTEVFGDLSIVTRVLYVVLICCIVATFVSSILFAIRLLQGKRRFARLTAEVIIFLLVADIICTIMLHGISAWILIYAVDLVVLIAVHTYIDPSLSEERELQRKLRDMDIRSEAEAGTLGRDKTGEGYISLDFFNLFWIFTIACVFGDFIETIYHFVVVVPGEWEIRAGMLWGPFSPIYGFGAVLMTIALNRFHKANVVIIFLVSAVIGGAFEYLVSWFMEFAFGAVAWDYTGTFLSIGGRTNFMFMCMWGILGVVWIKLALPWVLKLVNLIPWKWRYSLTTICAGLMIFDGAMTLITLDCWYERLAGQNPDNAIAWFCADHFNNDYMANRFESMSIDPSISPRT